MAGLRRGVRRGPDSIVAKLPTSDPLLKLVYNRLGQNLREVCFYRELAGDFHVQTPGCYYGEKDPATGNTILLLEDMNYARQGDSVAGCTQVEVRACVEQLPASRQSGGITHGWAA